MNRTANVVTMPILSILVSACALEMQKEPEASREGYTEQGWTRIRESTYEKVNPDGTISRMNLGIQGFREALDAALDERNAYTSMSGVKEEEYLNHLDNWIDFLSQGIERHQDLIHKSSSYDAGTACGGSYILDTTNMSSWPPAHATAKATWSNSTHERHLMVRSFVGTDQYNICDSDADSVSYNTDPSISVTATSSCPIGLGSVYLYSESALYITQGCPDQVYILVKNYYQQ